MRELREKIKQFEQVALVPQVIKWSLVSALVALLSGTASAGFLAALEWATAWRETHLWIIMLLPIGGFLIGWMYLKYGTAVEAGNNLLIDEIHDPQKIIPLRMTPLVLLGTVASHFFGASVGREGTAVQMGGSLADQLTRPLKFGAEDRRILLMAGVSAGFSSIFGTPLAGAIFGLEVLAIGKLRYDAIFPCFFAAILANQITLAWGIHHTEYAISEIPKLTSRALLAAILAGIAFGVVGMIFAKSTHYFSKQFKEKISYAPMRSFVGGLIVAAAVLLFGTTKYIGLGIPTIVDSFHHGLPPWDFALKLLFTTFCLGAGFKGGEVTPLFFIGATLGNVLSPVLGLPHSLLAGMGFVAVFAGAANTPLSSTFMAIELFGPNAGIFAGIACVMSYLFSGHAGIYQSQRIGLSKTGSRLPEAGLTLAAWNRSLQLPLINIFQDLHFFGILKRKENEIMMKQMASLRLYFHHSTRLQTGGFWKKLTAPTLGAHLASKAKTFGIEQFILHRVSAGYLKGDPLVHDISEVPPHRLPQCAELIDRVERLRAFLLENVNELKDARIVMMRLEDPLFDSVTDTISSLSVLEDIETAIPLL